MCEHRGIQCYFTASCSKLCDAASRWANQDYVDRAELQLPIETIERIAAKQSMSRVDGASCGTMRLADDVFIDLTPKQRAAIEVVFYDQNGRQSYREAARKLGITKNAAHHRINNAIRLIRERVGIGRPTNSREKEFLRTGQWDE